MTHRQRILAAIRGELTDRLPWAPRLDFWYRAHTHAGTLPPDLRGLDLHEIAARINAAVYATIPDFTTCPEAERNRTLGMLSWADCPYEIAFDGVDRRIETHGRETMTEYHSPAGSIRTSEVSTEEMIAAGASVSWITRHAIRGPEDFAVVGDIFARMRVVPRPERYRRFRETVGEEGVAVAKVHGTCCPLHLIMKELMSTEAFFYALADYPAALERLCDDIEPVFAAMRRIVADLPAEVVYLGANYDDGITHAAFYRKHLMPHLASYASELHGCGKYLLTHTDGENRRLLPAYLETGFDIADSVCPYPMTRCTIEQLAEAFEGRITIWGGIPSVLLCRDSASDSDFRTFIDKLIRDRAGRSRFVLGVSDMVTADCDWDRVRYIGEAIDRAALH
jgi:hypothetical protein